MTQTSMTYGTLPTREDFDAAFDRECPNGYRITLSSSDSDACEGFKLGDGTWTADQLWAAITEIVNEWGDSGDNDHDSDWYENQLCPALDLVSSIMGTLGFEWI